MLRRGVSPGLESQCSMQGEGAVGVSPGVFWESSINNSDGKREEERV